MSKVNGVGSILAVETLARTIYGEARGEADRGKVAIAHVVLNRVRADLFDDNKPDWWGEGVVDVCMKPQQFSCWNFNDPNRIKVDAVGDDDPLFLRCLSIAALAMVGVSVDVTKGATHYHDTRLEEAPYWAGKYPAVALIGHHQFYKDPDATPQVDG